MQESKFQASPPDTNDCETQDYQLRISEHLYRRIEQQVAYLKHEEGEKISKSDWIINSILRKLEKDRGARFLNQPKKYRTVKLSLKKDLSKKLDQLLDSSKKILGGYSKKRWIQDAIEDMLEEESHKVERLAHQIHWDS